MTARLTGDSSISSITETISDGDHVNKCRLYEEELPQELWNEIFVRSSVESLLSVKCVSTRWHALVSNPSFIKRHLQLQKAMSKNNGRFLLKHYDDDIIISSCFLFDQESIASAATSSSSSLYSNPFHSLLRKGGALIIEGPINGFYCVYDTVERVVIWNPATKEAGFVPGPSYFLLEGYKFGDSPLVSVINNGIIGFGTDPTDEKDYKVVLICSYEIEDDVLEFCRMLYSTKTNTWVVLEDHGFERAGCPDRYSSSDTYLNGFYYWLVEHYENSMALAFDMGKQEFLWISLPYTDSENLCGDITLHNNDICLFVVNKNRCEIDIWVLIVEESSWRKKNSVSGIGGVKKSLGFWKQENELLLVIGDSANGQTVLYNTTSREITNLGPKGLFCSFKALVYYESLVSLGGTIAKYKGNHALLENMIWYFLSKHHGGAGPITKVAEDELMSNKYVFLIMIFSRISYVLINTLHDVVCSSSNL